MMDLRYLLLDYICGDLSEQMLVKILKDQKWSEKQIVKLKKKLENFHDQLVNSTRTEKEILEDLKYWF